MSNNVIMVEIKKKQLFLKNATVDCILNESKYLLNNNSLDSKKWVAVKFARRDKNCTREQNCTIAQNCMKILLHEDTFARAENLARRHFCTD